MFDIHSHILPGIDDGAKDLAESLALLQIAQNDGITHMVATPHIHLGRFNNTITDINNDIIALKLAAENNGIFINLAVAAEIRLDVELMGLVISNRLPFIGKVDNFNYMLLELPHSNVPQGFDKLITWLANKNVKVIIPHPERNRDIQSNPFYIQRLKQLGCEFQLTASSIEGAWGEAAKAISFNMLESNIVKYIASDAHSVKRRPPILSKAREIVSELIGCSKANEIFCKNPESLTKSLFNEK